MIQKKEYSLQDFESRYNDITTLYTYAEELLGTVETPFTTDPAHQLEMVEPLINELSDATDMLAEEFILIAENRRFQNPQNKSGKLRIEGALRKIFSAIHDYRQRVKDVTKEAHGALQNIADPIVKKIQRQMENIVVIFLEFVHYSLQSVMNKIDLDALKQRNARVALMMHQISLGQQG